MQTAMCAARIFLAQNELIKVVNVFIRATVRVVRGLPLPWRSRCVDATRLSRKSVQC